MNIFIFFEKLPNVKWILDNNWLSFYGCCDKNTKILLFLEKLGWA